MKIYKDFAQVLIKRASDLYKDDYFRIGLKEKVYAFDSSTMKLCLNLYPWAKFHHNKGTFKMHTLINLRGSIPTFIWLTEGKVYDMNGKTVMENDTEIAYNRIELLDNNEICVRDDYNCELFTIHSIRKFRYTFDRQLYNVLSGLDGQNYTLVLNGEIEEVRLQ